MGQEKEAIRHKAAHDKLLISSKRYRFRSCLCEATNIALKNTEEDPHEEIDNVDTFSYITTKYRISNESYHELSMQFPELPRSYKVIS